MGEDDEMGENDRTPTAPPGATAYPADDAVRQLSDALVSAAPAAWLHVRGEFDSKGRGKAFAATPTGAVWLHLPAGAEAAVQRHRSIGPSFAKLTIDLDPGQPPAVRITPGPTGARNTMRRLLIGLTIACLLGAAVIAALVTTRPAPTTIPVTTSPSPSPRQLAVQRLVEGWYDDQHNTDPAWLRQLACHTPTGRVAEDIAEAEAGAVPAAITRIEGFTDFIDNGATGQIRVWSTATGLNARANEQIAQRKEGFFSWTFVYLEEDGETKLCGG